LLLPTQAPKSSSPVVVKKKVQKSSRNDVEGLTKAVAVEFAKQGVRVRWIADTAVSLDDQTHRRSKVIDQVTVVIFARVVTLLTSPVMQ
jgi:hypothetical protein